MTNKRAQDHLPACGFGSPVSCRQLCISLILCALAVLAYPAAAQNHLKLYGQVDEVNYVCGAAGITVEGGKLPGRVSEVRMGSPAFYAGLEKNDRILSGSIGQNKLALIIDRSGKTYSLSVNTGPVDLTKMNAQADNPLKTPVLEVTPHGMPTLDVTTRERPIPVVDVTPHGMPTLDVTTRERPIPVVDVDLPPEKRLEAKLKKYDIVLVVDASGSMNYQLASEPISKWDWCRNHIVSFAARMKPILGDRGITLVTFNETYQKEKGCSPERVENTFRSRVPGGWTDMGSPLQDVLSDFLATGRGRPLLVVVMTDGMPNRGPEPKDVIRNATHEMRSADEIKMTFLEIGEEFNGREYLQYLDDYLPYDGAKYDIVDSMTFDQFRKVDLVGAIIHALDDTPKPAPSGTDLRAELEAVQKKIDAARAAKSSR